MADEYGPPTVEQYGSVEELTGNGDHYGDWGDDGGGPGWGGFPF